MLRHAGPDGHIDPDNDAFWTDLNAIIANGTQADSYLYQLDRRGIINYEEVGEDGFAPIVIAGVKAQTHSYLAQLFSALEADTLALEREVKELLTFDPEQLTADIEKAQAQLAQAKAAAEANEMLQPILKPIGQIERNFASVVEVSRTYENVYKNIIRPVQREGQAGVKATVRWAIISIIVSTALSVGISNWSKLSALWAAFDKTSHPTAPASSGHVG